MKNKPDKKKLVIISIFILFFSAATIFSFNQCSNSPHSFNTDINKDGVTDSLDYTKVSRMFGQSCNECAEDINSDNKVDGEDLLILIGNSN